MGHGAKGAVILAGALALGGVTGGCATVRAGAWTTTTTSTMIPVTPAAQAEGALVARGETEWAQRGREEHALAAVQAWSRALEATPTDAVLWARLARAQYFLADAHYAPDPGRAVQASDMFAAAITSGERSILAREPELGTPLRSGRRLSELLSMLEEQDVPGLYWRTMALSRWARGYGMFTLNSVRDELRASMSRCAELDRLYDGAGADRFLADSWAGASTVQGGDLERARRHFEYAIHAAPDHLGTRVLFALDYAVKMQDRELFQTQIEAVLSADPGGDDVAPENAIEQRRARAALDRMWATFSH